MSDQLSPDTTGHRKRLAELPAVNSQTHAGLWFDRYYVRVPSKPDAENKRSLLSSVANLQVPEVYKQYFEVWRTSLPSDCRCTIAEVRGRMVLGTGDKGVAEAGLTLHHTYGVPYIPGSALKGLAAAYAHQRLADATWHKSLSAPDPTAPLSDHEVLFGSTRSAGYVTFFDALYIPGAAPHDKPLAPDVITGHHSAYYVGDAPSAPADWDSPVPVPFLTATGRYLIAVAGPETWAEVAEKLIGMALRDIGVGAKTAAGYGRMALLTLDGKPIHLPVPSQPTGNTSVAEQSEKLDVGVLVTGNRKGELRISSGRGVRVDLNLKNFQLPKGKTVIGFIRRADAEGKVSGGFRGTIADIEVEGTTIYLVLKPHGK